MVSTPTLKDSENVFRNSKETEAWDDACWELANALGEYPNGEELFDAYWRTLVFNTERLGSVAPPDLKISYMAWISLFMTGNEIRGLCQQPQQPVRDDVRPKSTRTWGWMNGFTNKIATKWRGVALTTKLLWKLEIAKRQSKAGERFDDAFKRYSFGRKFCITANGYMGWAPSEAKIDDLVCYFEGCPLPYVIRGRDDGYELIGDCYIHGIMHEPPKGLDMNVLEVVHLV